MSPTQNKQYLKQARWTLQNAFPGVSCAWIDSVHHSYDFKFTDTFNALTAVVNGDGEGKTGDTHSHIKIFLKRERAEKVFQLTNAQLREEVEGIPELNTKQKSDAAIDTKVDRAVVDLIDLTLDDSVDLDPKQGPETECLCCYADYPFTDLLECSVGSGHLVCRGCIGMYISEQLDGNDSVAFKCIAEADCAHKYSHEMLNTEGILSPKLKTRMNDRVFRADVEAAGLLGNGWTCPTCAYVGWIDGQLPSWILCPECNIQYCTACNDTVHHGTCDEARKAKADQKDPKLRVSEAMSQAAKRFCPHCNQEYLKAGGCNKITCKCGKKSCYLCGEKIESYSHFCRHPLDPGTACTCGKCKLFTSTEEMEQIDRNRRHAAGRKVLAEAGITDKQEIRSLLQSPNRKKAPNALDRVPQPYRNAHQQAAAQDRRPNRAPPVPQNGRANPQAQIVEHINGNAVHNGNFVVRRNGDGSVGGNAVVNGYVMLNRNANGGTIGDNATVNGYVFLHGGNSLIQGNASIRGAVVVSRHATGILEGNATVQDGVFVYGTGNIRGNATINRHLYIKGNATIEGNAVVGGNIYDGQGQRVPRRVGERVVVANGRVVPQPQQPAGGGAQQGAQNAWPNGRELNDLMQDDPPNVCCVM